ncbi:pirin family protein [Sphingopyxis alaskensis]|jgi:redox-sensitive bicupin YhaK (pirin superfamily)|uniref:Pirin-like protein n=1 Tax=Sphingopyxis alaskensis (strain DSM 13593 / LMG 18877 / RB2256) TaxID=317655 RepID=Q1GVF2_SPHAL|nr:pirin family protein [Sphingopyxis alaskensis]ABF52370.1 Pirin-like protein [Sphingopyxis alaskensis RB2256]MCM3420356.1 pirin family protein [Sphingopyxis alaskensis]
MFDVITPSTHDLGAFEVRRTLPNRARTMVGPFIFVDQFGPAHFDIGKGMDVRPHPHINLATVTYLFEGAIDHRDSLGTYATIRPGACNLMTAGRGIVHSERTPQAERATGSAISGMQTWLALPDGKEEIDPAFEHVAKDDLPLVEDNGVSARVIMGSLWGAASPITQHSATIYADILMNAGATIPIDAEADERAVLVALGDASLDGEPLDRHSLYILKPGQAMRLRATSDARVMLLGGEAFTTPRHVWWNFVSSSRDRINEAKHDWKAGRFPLVPGDSEEFIPIPEVPKTVSYP